MNQFVPDLFCRLSQLHFGIRIICLQSHDADFDRRNPKGDLLDFGLLGEFREARDRVDL